ncbi:MFS transporter [Thermobifida halotolerans]|uniref:MFS transporter n=1 Tax=Thermobifida halotolerans TaxID=483545 RepID=A0A399FYL9_9ACTN|nr:MFS transporter [Thermobifida halotolerans]
MSLETSQHTSGQERSDDRTTTVRQVASEPPGGARAWLVWGIAAVVYFLAMFHRNGMSAAALHAQERFDVGPALLSALPTVQLVIYVLFQIPAGLLADRLGPRRSLVISLGVMAAGTVLFAVAPDVRTAVAGRLLIGAGDSLVFLNVIRTGALWFPRRHYSLVSALTGLVGGLGQLSSAVPLSALLNGVGWEVSFLGAGAVSLLTGALVLLLVRDRPDGRPAPSHALPSVRESIVEALSHRGPRVGMAAHAVIMVPFTVLGILWGYPLLEEGYGLSARTAGLLLTGAMALPMALVPFLGRIPGRHPSARRPLVLALAWTVTLSWLGVVAWPGGLPPLAVTAAVIVVSAFATVMAPSLSFDYARDGLPEQRTGTASGLVNMSGFTSVMLGVVSAGVLLDLTGADASFQLAFVPMVLLCLAASVTITVLLRRPRR